MMEKSIKSISKKNIKITKQGKQKASNKQFTTKQKIQKQKDYKKNKNQKQVKNQRKIASSQGKKIPKNNSHIQTQKGVKQTHNRNDKLTVNHKEMATQNSDKFKKFQISQMIPQQKSISSFEKYIQREHTLTNTNSKAEREIINLIGRQKLAQKPFQRGVNNLQSPFLEKLNHQKVYTNLQYKQNTLQQIKIQFQKAKQWRFITIYEYILHKFNIDKQKQGLLVKISSFFNINSQTSKADVVEKEFHELQKQFQKFRQDNDVKLQQKYPKYANNQYHLISGLKFKQLNETYHKLQQDYLSLQQKDKLYNGQQIFLQPSREKQNKMLKQLIQEMNRKIDTDVKKIKQLEVQVKALKQQNEITIRNVGNNFKGAQSLKYSEGQFQQQLREHQRLFNYKFHQNLKNKLNKRNPYELFELEINASLSNNDIHKNQINSSLQKLKVYILDGKNLDQIVQGQVGRQTHELQKLLQQQELKINDIENGKKTILKNLQQTSNKLHQSQTKLKQQRENFISLQKKTKEGEEVLKFQMQNTIKQYEDKLSKQQTQKSNLLKDFSIIRQQLIQMQQRKDERRHQQMNQNKIKQSIQKSYESRLVELEKANKQLNQQLETKKREVSEKQASERSLRQKLQKKTEELNDKVFQAYQKIREIKQEKQRAEKLAALQCNMATQKIIHQISEKHSNEIQAKQQVIKDQKVKYQKDLNEYQIKIYTLESKISEFQEQIRRLNSLNLNSNPQIESNQEGLSVYENQIIQLQEKVSEHEQIKSAYETRIKKMKQESGQLLIAATKLESQKAQFEEKISQLMHEMKKKGEEQAQENNNIEAHIRHLEDQNQGLKKNFTNMKNEKDILNMQLSSEKKRVQKLKKKIEEMEQKERIIQSLQKLSDTRLSENAKLEEQLQKTIAQKQRIQIQSQQLKSNLAKGEQKLREFQQKQNQYKRQLDQKSQSIRQLKSLTNDMEKSNIEKASIINRVNKINQEIVQSFVKLGIKIDQNALNSENRQSQDIHWLLGSVEGNFKRLIKATYENQTHLQSELHRQVQKEKRVSKVQDQNLSITRQLEQQKDRVASLIKQNENLLKRLQASNNQQSNQAAYQSAMLQMKLNLNAQQQLLIKNSEQLRVYKQKLNQLHQQLDGAQSHASKQKKLSQQLLFSESQKANKLQIEISRLNEKIIKLQRSSHVSNQTKNSQNPPVIESASKIVNFAAQILIKKPQSVQFLNSVIEKHTKACIDLAQIIYKKSLESKDLTRKMHQVLAEKTPLRAFLLLCRSRSNNDCAILCSKNDKDEILTLLINLSTMQVFGPREGTSARAYSEKNGVSTVEFGEGAVRIQNSDSLVLQLDFEMMGAKYFDIENERDFTNEQSKEGNLRMEEMELYSVIFKQMGESRFNV